MQAYRMEKLFHSMRALNSSTDYEFSSVDRLFVSQRLPLQKCVADVFKDEVHKMDFVVDPELARLYINNWVANQTNAQIKDLIPSSKISYNTRLVLVNISVNQCFWTVQYYNISCDSIRRMQHISRACGAQSSRPRARKKKCSTRHPLKTRTFLWCGNLVFLTYVSIIIIDCSFELWHHNSFRIH